MEGLVGLDPFVFGLISSKKYVKQFETFDFLLRKKVI